MDDFFYASQGLSGIEMLWLITVIWITHLYWLTFLACFIFSAASLLPPGITSQIKYSILCYLSEALFSRNSKKVSILWFLSWISSEFYWICFLSHLLRRSYVSFCLINVVNYFNKISWCGNTFSFGEIKTFLVKMC